MCEALKLTWYSGQNENIHKILREFSESEKCKREKTKNYQKPDRNMQKDEKIQVKNFKKSKHKKQWRRNPETTICCKRAKRTGKMKIK